MDNQKKYGTKKDDEISRQFTINDVAGVVFCLGNISKYIRRWLSEDNEKSRLDADLSKIVDYAERLRDEKVFNVYHLRRYNVITSFEDQYLIEYMRELYRLNLQFEQEFLKQYLIVKK